MTDQEIIDKAIAEVRAFQTKVANAIAERELEQARFETIMEVVIRKTKCERITAERIIKEIIIQDTVHKSQLASGTCEGCNKPSSTILCQDCFNTGDFQ